MERTISKTYVITDTHFFHSRIVTDFCFRPSNFNQVIVNNWVNTVQENDIVFHLGDVIWGNQEQLRGIMEILPGKIVLIRGNHDISHSNNWFLQAGFDLVLEKAQVSGVVLSHMPTTLSSEEIDKDFINVFGHFHNNSPERWEEKLKARITKNHYLLSLEDVGYKPVLLEEIRKGKYVKNAFDMLKGVNKNI